MSILWVQGVVKNGQVVLDPPLDRPDGTVMTVMDYDPDGDPRPQGPKPNLTGEEIEEVHAFFCGKKDKALWPEFEARLVEKYGPWLPHHRRSAA
ncbi:MAG: hypothetical protein J0I06_23910 [Planctomycetes bacterium]|nr:hypothetical protein [Planctomycetota bacterium]